MLLAVSLVDKPEVLSPNEHFHPFGAVALLPIVTTPEQVPVVPEAKVPAVAPPVNDVPEQVFVESVKVVPP